MSRRQTLAGLSPSQLNASNAAPGRALKDGSTLPAKGRKSMATGLASDRPSGIGLGLDRRGSVIGAKPGGPKQDPRPLNSKDYQANCIRFIITYLSTRNFTAGISPKTLSSPTGKDFFTLVTFLFQQVDPTFRIQGKVEDDVIIFFKRLNYPFQISKSALFAVGSPHSWPAVLAALRWVVELLQYSLEVADCKASFEGENKANKEFQEFLEGSYGAFMSGIDERCQQLDDDLLNNFKARDADLDNRCEKIKQANAELLAELEQERSLPDPVAVAQQQDEDQDADMHKFEQLIQGLQAQKQGQTRKLLEKTSGIRAKQDQVAAAVAELEQLRQRVASQTINKADLNRMILERNKQNEMLASEKAKCEQMECKVHEQGVQVLRGFTSLDATVERYNKLAHRLKLIPATSKRADGINYELRINRDTSSQLEFSSLDLKGVVKPGLERLAEAYRTRASHLSLDLDSLREACVARGETNAEKQEEIVVLQAEIARVEAQLQAAKDAYEEKCRRFAAQADGLKAQGDELRSVASNRTEHIEERLSRSQLAYEQAKRDGEAELLKLEADLKTAMQMFISHKEFISDTISHTASAVRQIKGQVVRNPTQ